MDGIATNRAEKLQGIAFVCFTAPMRLHPSRPRDSTRLLVASRFAREGVLEASAVMEGRRSHRDYLEKNTREPCGIIILTEQNL
ncbi:hypothetical protein E2562_020610 [Oryza meyeriana var. granulata]|uniref:Uncharacterized protein n=1 Tax=Oryza meyeriana var. granulata TaxID=110450 RepID=A0A6G1DY40_9ORYZ|nr:hypothetical protein E2562_020610 [Oryza meyeriana var. granulata]